MISRALFVAVPASSARRRGPGIAASLLSLSPPGARVPRRRPWGGLVVLLLVALAVLVVLGGQAAAKPRVRDRELRLGSTMPVYIVGPATPQGVVRAESSGGGGTTLFGADVGLGYFVRDWFEVGALVTAAHATSAGQGQTLVGMAPLLRLLFVPHTIGLFVEAAPGFLIEAKAQTHPVFRLGTALGMEAFVTDLWAIRVGPTYELYVNRGGYQTLHALGATWGISAYF